MQSNHLTRLLVGGTTLALLNAALSVSVMTQPVSARELVANANATNAANPGGASAASAAMNARAMSNMPSRSGRQASRPYRPHQNQNQSKETKANDQADSGTLVAMASGGKQLGSCPLKHTDVQAEISGYIARVTVNTARATLPRPWIAGRCLASAGRWRSPAPALQRAAAVSSRCSCAGRPRSSRSC
jgi:hypothetical protein